MLFQKFTLGLKMHSEAAQPKASPIRKAWGLLHGLPGIMDSPADALMTQTERIKSIHLRPGKKVYSWEHQWLCNQTHRAEQKQHKELQE